MLFLITLLTLPVSFAQTHYILKTGTFVPEDADVSEYVDLSDQFNENKEAQTAGSCHIHAMSSYIERTCKLLTGREIKLSRSYFLFRHLKQEITTYPISELSNSLNYSFFEGGFAGDTFNRFMNGDAIAENETRLTEKNLTEFNRSLSQEITKINNSFTPTIEKLLQESSVKCKKPSEFALKLDQSMSDLNPSFQSRIITQFDNFYRCHQDSFSSSKSDELGLKVTSSSEVIQDCIATFNEQKLKLILFKGEDNFITHLLKNKTPVLCRGKFINTIAIKSNPLLGITSHQLIIVGYKKDYHTGAIEYMVRDSGYINKNPYTVTGCENIAFIAPEETFNK